MRATSPSALHETLEERLSAELQDVYFDYDSSNLREDARQSLSHTSVALKAIITDFPEEVIVIEGHCDDGRPSITWPWEIAAQVPRGNS
jgi:outer membrane protein OmpA-like peptidoglycan-associated protein